MNKIYDVIQIGYGPVSQMLALILGRQGRSVAVCERWKTRYPLPRAVCIDHEIYRILSANGLGPLLPQVTHSGPRYQWFNAEWKELLSIDWGAQSISGGAEVNFVHQPTLEATLDSAVAQQETVELYLGWQATAIEQTSDLVHVHLLEADTGLQRTLSCRYLVGCDGANSLVRGIIGSGQEDRGFEADWLVIDVLLKRGVTIQTLGIPAAGQYCDPRRPTTIVPAGIRDGRVFRRWEFMRLPGEEIEDLEQEERVWELLKPWVSSDDVELVRHKVYNFRSLLAQKWRDRRIFVAGDAAHTMPPFLGQGMCSGIRDAANLSWKLGLVLDGIADDALLDSYQQERMPHVSQIIDISIYLGKIICIPDSEEAARRDQTFLSGIADPPPPFPMLMDGVFHRDGQGHVDRGAGLLSPHAIVERHSERHRLDDMTRPGFTIISCEGDPESVLAPEQREAWSRLGANYICLGDSSSRHFVFDFEHKLSSFLRQHEWDVMIVRPDYYVYGGARNLFGLSRLLTDLFSDVTGSCLSV